jgi:tRNA dimethylallyltransferase
LPTADRPPFSGAQCRSVLPYQDPKPKVLALVGPTAAGKSALAMKIAPELKAEIVSMDSGMVYRGMDIGTDKPTPADRLHVAHHMVDVVEPSECVSVAGFQQMARAAVSRILKAGRAPLLVGGSGLYFRSVVDPLEFPPHDSATRARLEALAAQVGAEALYERLLSLDPVAAGRIHPSNSRRTIRALEVIELTGRPFSRPSYVLDQWTSIYDLVAVGLTLPLPELDTGIEARVDRMLGAGWIGEVEGLERHGRWSATSIKTLGYADLLDHIKGVTTLEEATSVIKGRTRKFARRQLRWFRADPRIRWFDSEPNQAAAYLVAAGAEHRGAHEMSRGA